MVHTCNGIQFSHKKEWKSVVCDILDGTGDHYVNWNKPSTERQVPHDLTHMDSKTVDLTEVESKMVVTRGWRNKRWGKDRLKLINSY